MTDAEALQAFVVAAARLKPDLARWAGELVWRGLSASRRRRMRDDLLRQAARLLPPLSSWQKAHVLADLARRPCARPAVGTAAELVSLALAVGSRGRRGRSLSAAQLFRVLTVRPVRFLHPGPDLQVEAVEGLGEMLANPKRMTR